MTNILMRKIGFRTYQGEVDLRICGHLNFISITLN